MIFLKAPWEIEKMRRSNAIVAEILAALREAIRPGMATLELNILAEKLCAKKGAKPAFKGYRGYPFSLCVSVNEAVVHGFPSERKLKEGDIVSLDFGVLLDGYYGDAAITVPVGKVSKRAERLLRVTEEALYKGIEQARAGHHLYDISAAIQRHAESHGYAVVRQFVGHGIGRALHEDPQVPNFGKPGRGIKLKAGMVLAIEPMVNEGTYEVEILADGWTAVTKDRKLSAHFEHTVAITENGPEILSKV
ncbi:MAG: type I methionyl aminopeptidase [Candidatus Desulfofervidaceae bacterium]|nr:type I methionyl aminopeptidase [Candidatus Desulfofervidaceae bacterium]MDL1970074.1 type I methionyl aminopeptidase [Candidatus Desulfofervidaceae bacterium]